MTIQDPIRITGVTFSLKPYSVKQLAEIYGVSTKTFRRWLSPYKEEVGEKLGYFYTITQVQRILHFLGIPGFILTD
jgi:transposase